MTVEEKTFKLKQIKQDIQLMYWMFKYSMTALVLCTVGITLFAITMICVILGAQDLVRMIMELKNIKP